MVSTLLFSSWTNAHRASSLHSAFIYVCSEIDILKKELLMECNGSIFDKESSDSLNERIINSHL